MSSITTKVFILSAVECWSEGIDHRINFAQSWKSHTNYNWEGESFIMFQRHNITKVRKANVGYWKLVCLSQKTGKKCYPIKVVVHQYIQILLRSQAGGSFEVGVGPQWSVGRPQTGKVLFTTVPFVSAIFHKRAKFVWCGPYNFWKIKLGILLRLRGT